jgi:hypothetical protein
MSLDRNLAEFEARVGKEVPSHPIMIAVALYGPYMFSIASLLIIWFSIVAPELKSRAVNYDQHREIVEAMREVTSQQREISRALESTTKTLDAILKQARLPGNDVNS